MFMVIERGVTPTVKTTGVTPLSDFKGYPYSHDLFTEFT